MERYYPGAPAIPGWWALLLPIPLVNLAAYWVFAFKKWPAGQ